VSEAELELAIKKWRGEQLDAVQAAEDAALLTILQAGLPAAPPMTFRPSSASEDEIPDLDVLISESSSENEVIEEIALDHPPTSMEDLLAQLPDTGFTHGEESFQAAEDVALHPETWTPLEITRKQPAEIIHDDFVKVVTNEDGTPGLVKETGQAETPSKVKGKPKYDDDDDIEMPETATPTHETPATPQIVKKDRRKITFDDSF
jgi:hypothetical protein